MNNNPLLKLSKNNFQHIILMLLMTACLSEDFDVLSEQKSEVWVCHNPDSRLHLAECSDKCLVAGDQSVYCWLLSKEDCTQPLVYEWQNSCHLLEK